MQKKRPNEDFSIFDEVLDKTPEHEKIFVSRSLEIANQIIIVLEQKALLQKELADKLEKQESEISRWLSGFHNFTIKSIAKLEAVLGERIITTPNQARTELSNRIEALVDDHIKTAIERIRSERNRPESRVPTQTASKTVTTNIVTPRSCKVVNIHDFKKANINNPDSHLRPTGT